MRQFPTRCLGALTAAVLTLAAGLAADPAPASAEVRFGRGVFIGGHDFSNRSFNRKRRAVVHLYAGRPPRPGCAWQADGRGGRVQTCHLRRIRR